MMNMTWHNTYQIRLKLKKKLMNKKKKKNQNNLLEKSEKKTKILKIELWTK